MTMTPRERLEAMLERANAATKGPWTGGDSICTDWPESQSDDYSPEVRGYCIANIEDDGGYEAPERKQNSIFIAAARTDLPATVKCLLAVMARCNQTIDMASRWECEPEQAREAQAILDIINRELGE